jgi:SWI/SNF-related matrix-associated actin-dependent regulator of chromatin subfamily D
VEDQPWQADTLDVDAFDFSTNIDSSFRVKIEGRLLDDEEDALDSDDEDDEANGDAMDEDGKEKSTQKKSKLPTKQYKFSHFFKSMTVDFDRTKAKDVMDQSVEWKKPVVAPNATSLPNAADFDQLEFKRGGDENMNITINLVREENPERFKLSPPLADVLDTDVATRAEVMMGIWEYVKAMGLQDDDEKRAFECDDRLKAVSKPLSPWTKFADLQSFFAQTKVIFPTCQISSSVIYPNYLQSSCLTRSESIRNSTRILNQPSTTLKSKSTIL